MTTQTPTTTDLRDLARRLEGAMDWKKTTEIALLHAATDERQLIGRARAEYRRAYREVGKITGDLAALLLVLVDGLPPAATADLARGWILEKSAEGPDGLAAVIEFFEQHHEGGETSSE